MIRFGPMPRLIVALSIGVATLIAAPSAFAADNAVERAAAGANAANAEHNAAADGHGGVDASLLRGSSEGLIVGLTTLIVFLGLVVILGKFAWGPIASGLKAREDQIRKDIADAEAARARADATLREYEAKLATAQDQIRALLATATADGERAAEMIRLKGRQEAEEIKERANREIEASRDEAVREVYRQAADLSTAVAEKIIRRELNANDQRALIESSLDQLQTVR